MATILHYRSKEKRDKYLNEYIVISDTEFDKTSFEELDNWCESGYKLFSRYNLQGDPVLLPCDTMLIPEYQPKHKKT